jgi:hypothetical protein
MSDVGVHVISTATNTPTTSVVELGYNRKEKRYEQAMTKHGKSSVSEF